MLFQSLKLKFLETEKNTSSYLLPFSSDDASLLSHSQQHGFSVCASFNSINTKVYIFHLIGVEVLVKYL